MLYEGLEQVGKLLGRLIGRQRVNWYTKGVLVAAYRELELRAEVLRAAHLIAAKLAYEPGYFALDRTHRSGYFLC